MKPVPLSVLLEQFARKTGMVGRLKQGLTVEFWPRVVGAEVARQTVAGPVKDRVLWVRMSNPVLAHQLSLMEKEILHRYQKELGGTFLRGIHFRVGEVPTIDPGREEAVEGHAKALDPESDRKLREMAGQVADSSLAESFLRAARAWALTNYGAPHGTEQAYLELLTGESWPTAAEVKKALEAIEPVRRPAAIAQVSEILRDRILAVLQRGNRGNPASTINLRGDLRRLALAAGYPLTKGLREMAADLLGTDAGIAWPEQK